MEKKIQVYDGSRRLNRAVPLKAIRELNRITPVNFQLKSNPEQLVDKFVRRNTNRASGQVNYDDFLEDMNNAKHMQRTFRDGKMIIIDEDFYTDKTNWVFGGFSRIVDGLGLIAVSTHRIKDNIHALDIFRHELGHMFNATSHGREGTYESLGPHCSTPMCVMQQNLLPGKALRYSHERARSAPGIYCPKCSSEIRKYGGRR